MAYKQKPGRGNSPKTGNGLPTPLKAGCSPMKQERPRSTVANMDAERRYTPELRKAIEDNSRKNIRLKKIESTAKQDSVSAATNRLKAGGSKFSAGLQGNLAANKVRKDNNSYDLVVDRGKKVDAGASLSSGQTSYTRRKPTVEKDVAMVRNKQGLLDVMPKTKKK
jgi:hypothetical protein